jgi:vesicle coat complex subunit
MEFNYYINENLSLTNIVYRAIKNIDKLKSVLKNSFNDFIKILKEKDKEKEFLEIFNKQFKTNYKSLDKLKSLKENEEINEDWKNFLKFWKNETYPALSIFPTLQIWFEIDKLLDGMNLYDLNWKKVAIYGILWIIIVTGQHAILWKKWKKENPEEWEKEGKPGIFRRGETNYE